MNLDFAPVKRSSIVSAIFRAAYATSEMSPVVMCVFGQLNAVHNDATERT